MSHTASSSLRAVTFRISSTPTKQLPHLIPWIINTLQSSKSLLASTGAGKAKDSTDSVLLHKFKTQITALLNDKTSEGRWAAVVLVKTTIDLGGWEILQSSGAWGRTLLGILGKQDSLAVKKLCIITLTRIFLCTHEYPTLIREITTPCLPAFLTACLNLVDPKSAPGQSQQARPKNGLLSVVLECFGQLLPNHPTIFRSFESRLTEFLLPLMAPAELFDKTHGSAVLTQSLTSSTIIAARNLYILLHYCAPKSTSGEDWLKRISTTLNQCHRTADIVFRAVIEDYDPVARSTTKDLSTINFSTAAKEEISTVLPLPAWYGLRAGSTRLVGLLGLVKSFIMTPTASPVSFPIAEVIDLTLRALSVAGPTGHGAQDQSAMAVNKEIGRDEREELFIELPSIHEAVLVVLGALLERFGSASATLVPVIVDQIGWTFKREAHSSSVRLAAYETVAKALLTSGSGFTRPQILDLSRMVRSVCEDILPEEPKNGEDPKAQVVPAKGQQKQMGTLNADTFLNPHASTPRSLERSYTRLHEAAVGFLAAFLTRIPAHHIGQSLRAVIDRTTVLSGNADLMLASVLNPPHSTSQGKARSSILPLLARAAPENAATEALLRPRLPAIRVNLLGRHGDEENEEEDDEQVTGDDAQDDDIEQNDSTEETSIREGALASLPAHDTSATTPEALPLSNANEVKAITDSLKRNASNVHPVTPDAKRSRTGRNEDPASKQLLTETAMPVPVVISNTSTKSSEFLNATTSPQEVVVSVVDDDNDGSDIEIPEIDIDPDTEDDDEDELA